MSITGEKVVFESSLNIINDVSDLHYEVWSAFENESISFLSELMNTSFSHALRFLNQMSEELPMQIETIYTVYKVNNEHIGAVFPHIEPNTDKQGRIFWIGIHPSYRGKGHGQALHLIGLYRLLNEFKTNSYLGMTQIDNYAMRKTMILNGCIENKNTVVSLEF